MKIGVIVQARMSSRRLPGKVLMPLAGKPVLQYVLERVERCERVSEVVVATSDDTSDDLLAAWCEQRAVDCWRGSLNDVAGRFLEVLESQHWDAVVRICGDSPLIDQRLIDQGVELFGQGEFDLVTNAWPRSFPDGQGVEVIRAATLQQAVKKRSGDMDREQFVQFFYRNGEKYALHNFAASRDYSNFSLAADTAGDLALLESLIGQMDRPHWSYGVDELMAMRESVLV